MAEKRAVTDEKEREFSMCAVPFGVMADVVFSRLQGSGGSRGLPP